MAIILKQRKTKSNFTIALIKRGDLYVVECLNRLGKVTSWRYAGKSLENAEKHYNK